MEELLLWVEQTGINTIPEAIIFAGSTIAVAILISAIIRGIMND